MQVLINTKMDLFNWIFYVAQPLNLPPLYLPEDEAGDCREEPSQMNVFLSLQYVQCLRNMSHGVGIFTQKGDFSRTVPVRQTHTHTKP